MHVKEMGRKDLNLIHLSRDKVHWWGIVNTFVFNKRGGILLPERLLAFRSDLLSYRPVVAQVVG